MIRILTDSASDILPAEGVTEGELLTLAAALERKSEHPLAKAVLAHTEAQKLDAPEVTDFAALPGNGLAAKLDGASEARIFFQIVIPMSRPILVYTIISSFLTPWTDFVVAKMILNSGVSSDWTVAIGLYNMLQKALVNSYFSRFCAGGVLVAVPISILFVIMQKFYVEGITSGAAKG